METDARQAVESPCIMSCVVDQNHGFCLGCWRTLREISDWHRYFPEQKHAVLAEIETRRATHSTPT
ncbi:MAG: DUF1289 domain-containing protein [Burkholderiales bacterium]|nr:DUF1289 domain-containing protein [Burkholderiales bacterium]